jgi:hypothetical protein
MKTEKGQIVRSGLFFAIIFTWILFLAGQATCFASTVTLQWDPNTESDLAGYKVYYKADSSTQPLIGTGAAQGAAPVDVLKQTTATVSGLDPNHAYYFAVTAYNTPTRTLSLSLKWLPRQPPSVTRPTMLQLAGQFRLPPPLPITLGSRKSSSIETARCRPRTPQLHMFIR